MWPWSVLSFTIVLVAMEPYSAWVHRVVWHGPLWSLHRSHHRERIGAHTSGGLVANDALSASHVPISMALIAWGFFEDGVIASIAMGAGLGLGAFGLLYVVFHDGMVHGRLPIEALGRHGFLASIRSAHELHHRRNGAPYGFFASALFADSKRAAAPLDPTVAPPMKKPPQTRRKAASGP